VENYYNPSGDEWRVSCDSFESGTQGVEIPPDACHTNRVNQTTPTMRKIERLMVAAIKAGKDFKLDNTEVVSDAEKSDVFLHGNLIACVGETFIELFDGGWQTVTTKSRLNAIIASFGLPHEGIFQRKGEWFVNTNDVTLRFVSGMRLA